MANKPINSSLKFQFFWQGFLVSFFLFYCLNSIPSFAESLASEPPYREQKGFSVLRLLKDTVHQLSIKANLDVLDQEIMEGFSIGASYRPIVEPNFPKQAFSRYDIYRVKMDLMPGDMLLNDNLPLELGIRAGSEVSFARTFRSQKEALTARPYFFNQAPFTSEVALKKLKPGDFVSFKANLNFVAEKAWSFSNQPNLAMGASVFYIISGEFQIHFFKLDENRVRLKLFAYKNNHLGFASEANYQPLVNVFEVRILDRQVARITKVPLFKMGSGGLQSKLLINDYVFHFAYPEVRKAYDNLMRANISLSKLKYLTPISDVLDLKNQLFSDLALTEKIFSEDLNLPPAQRRIDRIFSGQSSGDGSSWGFSFGVRLVEFSYQKGAQELRLQSKQRNSNLVNYNYSRSFVNEKVDTLASVFKNDTREAYTVLLAADENNESREFLDLRFELRIEDAHFTIDNFNGLKRRLEKRLGPQFAKEVPLQLWEPWVQTMANAFIKMDVVFNKKSLLFVQDLSADYLYFALRNFLKGMPRLINPRPQPRRPHSGLASSDQLEAWTWIDGYELELRSVGRELSRAFSSRAEPDERVKRFLALRYSRIFNEYGCAFLLSLLPPMELKEIVGIEIFAGALGHPNIEFKFGEIQNRELYRTLEYIQNVMGDRSINMELLENERGELVPHFPEGQRPASGLE